MSHSILCSWTFGALFWDPIDLLETDWFFQTHTENLPSQHRLWALQTWSSLLLNSSVIATKSQDFLFCFSKCVYMHAFIFLHHFGCVEVRGQLWGGQFFPFTWIPRIKFKSPGLPAEPSCWLKWGFLAWLCSLSLSCHLVSESPFPTQDSRQTFLWALGISVSLESSLCSCLLCSSPGRSNLTS